MSKSQAWGIYAPYIRQLIDLKRGLGFKYVTQESIFLRFDRFTIERGEMEVGISKELADKWCEKLGIRSYIPRIPRRKSTFTPYIYSKKEMTLIFNAADTLVLTRRIMNSMIFVVPALLRLLYGTGLRIGEALSLQNKDVNLTENYIVIKDSKNEKHRMIPISESLSAVCQDYINHREKLPVLQSNDHPFFINLNGSACVPHTFHRYFRLVLKAAGIPYKGKMAESGIDLYTTLPVLSTYLGHQSLSSTNAYVRLTAAMYPGLLKDVDMICLNVFPNVENYEAD